jgi:adenylate cyclase
MRSGGQYAPPMGALAERGALQPVSLRFLDGELEERYQRAAGAESIGGLRVITAASVAVWAAAAVLVPIGTGLPAATVLPIAGLMMLISLVAFVLSGWARTLDRQHAIASVLTAANAMVILVLASLADALPGYGVAAILLLYVFAFVSRTRFVFAAARSGVIAVAFLVAVLAYAGPENLALDGLFFVTATAGSLLALHTLEHARRRVFFQDLVIREQSQAIAREREKSDRLLLNVMPASISARLREGASEVADEYASVTVMFADIVGFTPLAAGLQAPDVVRLLNSLFSAFDELVATRGLEKIKTIGDSYMAAGGLPEALDRHASRIVELGLAMIDEASRHGGASAPIKLRIGVHSGTAVGGVIGKRKIAFDVWGDTVNVASRLEEQGVAGRIQISEATRLLLGDEFDWESRGSIDLKGHGSMATFLIIGPRRVTVADGVPEARGETLAAP